MTPDVHRAALEALPQRVAILDSRGTLVYVNAAWRTAPDDPAQLGGGAYREGRDFVTLLGAAGSEAGRHMAEGVADVLEGRAPHFELEHPVGSGPEERWLHTRVDGLGGNGGAIVVQSDVTTRRRQSRRLASAELRLRQLAEHIDEVFFLTDPGWERLFYVSPAYEKVWGRPRQPLVAAPLAWTDAIHPEDAEAVRARMAEADDGAWRAEFRILRPDGTLRWIRAKTFPVRDPEGRVIRVAGVAADVTEHKLTERALERAHEETLEILERIPVGVVLNRAGEVLYMNTTAARYLGYGAGETLVGERLDDLLHPDERESLGPRIREMHADDDSEGREIRLRHASGEYVSLYVVPVRVIRYQGKPVNLIAAWDVTALRRAEAALEESAAERDRLEMQLETAQRIESLGRLAGGIAHDFNNLITVINGNVELALGLVGDGPAGDSLEEIRRAGTRAASLTDQLLAFSRRQVLRPRVIDLNEVVEGVRSMLHRIIGEDVHLLLDPEEHIWPVRADAAQLEQVIVNLAVNARDAMPRGGDLTIRTRNVRLDDDFVRAHLGSTPGDHVLLEVEDTGEGMSEETLALIFEPFFTTKEIGKGTGLGLAMSYGIVKQSGGYIEADSELGSGTTMRIYLPRVEAPVDRVAERTGDEAPSGSETILLVEDETMVRLLAERVLRQQGYNVLSAGDAMEAIQTAGQYEGHIDLLLTDVVMPTISGRELAETLLQHRPDTVVLYMSGYTDDTVVKHGVLARETHFLHKPFTPAGLLTKVREVLDLARSAPAGD